MTFEPLFERLRELLFDHGSKIGRVLAGIGRMEIALQSLTEKVDAMSQLSDAIAQLQTDVNALTTAVNAIVSSPAGSGVTAADLQTLSDLHNGIVAQTASLVAATPAA